MHLEMEQLKRSNEESIAALKRTYDEKIRTYDAKLASLEQQLRSGRLLPLQSGTELFTCFYLSSSHFPREPITRKYRQILRPS